VMLHHSSGSRADQTTERDVVTELGRQSHAADQDTAHVEDSCEPESFSTVAEKSPRMEFLRLPEGAEALADMAISDEDDVEQGIEDSLQDVFATLQAEVDARRFSLPVTPLTSVIISQDSSSDDEGASSDVGHRPT